MQVVRRESWIPARIAPSAFASSFAQSSPVVSRLIAAGSSQPFSGRLHPLKQAWPIRPIGCRWGDGPATGTPSLEVRPLELQIRRHCSGRISHLARLGFCSTISPDRSSRLDREHPRRALRRLCRAGGHPGECEGRGPGKSPCLAGSREGARTVRAPRRLRRFPARSCPASDEPVLLRFALVKLASIDEQLRSLAQGRIVFSGTETWRTVYEQLLQSPGLGTYRSVAWVKARDYWQDAPGRQSMRLNISLALKGLRIERIVILRDDLWPEGSRLPSAPIRPWIQQQHENGILVSLIREGDIAGESELAADFGLYGDRAVGTQEIDEEARTVRFVLEFDQASLRLARERWDRLSLYALPYADLVDRTGAGG